MKQNDDDLSSTIARDIESLSIEMMNTIVDRNKSYRDDILLCSVSLHMLMTSMMLLDDEHYSALLNDVGRMCSTITCDRHNKQSKFAPSSERIN